MMKNFLTLILLISMGSPLMAQNQSAIPYKANDSVMVTVILRHMQESCGLNPDKSDEAKILSEAQ